MIGEKIMNKNAIKIGFVSLGCSKNLIDTEVMLARLANAGYAESHFGA